MCISHTKAATISCLTPMNYTPQRLEFIRIEPGLELKSRKQQFPPHKAQATALKNKTLAAKFPTEHTTKSNIYLQHGSHTSRIIVDVFSPRKTSRWWRSSKSSSPNRGPWFRQVCNDIFNTLMIAGCRKLHCTIIYRALRRYHYCTFTLTCPLSRITLKMCPETTKHRISQPRSDWLSNVAPPTYTVPSLWPFCSAKIIDRYRSKLFKP